MPLETWSDTRATAKTDPSRKVWELVGERVHDRAHPMPPPSRPQLTAEELGALDDWLIAGGSAGDGGTCAWSTDAATGTSGSPKCDVSMEFHARTPGSDEPWRVGADSGDSYLCFYSASPFPAGSQAKGWRALIDDARVVHHLMLYGTNAPVIDGAVGPCQNKDVLIAGWDPGLDGEAFPDEVGLELDYAGYVLEIHYLNGAGYTDAVDRSGIAVCIAEDVRPLRAGIVTVGSTSFAIPPRTRGFQVDASCTHLVAQGAVHLLSVRPHMHNQGKTFSVRHQRAGESLGDLVNLSSWDPNSQRAFPLLPPRRVLPGDALQTQCTYDNPAAREVTYGENGSDEMCFAYLLAYPVGRLAPAVATGTRLCED